MVTMMEYENDLPVEVAFPPQMVEMCLARVISDAGLRQLHIAETEKYAHVTFFFNGMREDEFPGEDRVIIPSPRVSTYDKTPEMATPMIADRVVKEIANGQYDFIVKPQSRRMSPWMPRWAKSPRPRWPWVAW